MGLRGLNLGLRGLFWGLIGLIWGLRGAFGSTDVWTDIRIDVRRGIWPKKDKLLHMSKHRSLALLRRCPKGKL